MTTLFCLQNLHQQHTVPHSSGLEAGMAREEGHCMRSQ